MIECSRVSKWYGQVSALIDVSFRCEAGVVGLVRHNGAGKTTLIKLITNLLTPTKNQVKITNNNPHHTKTQQQLNYYPNINIYYKDLNKAQFIN